MTMVQELSGQGMEETPEAPRPQGSFVSRLIWTFMSPKKLYADIDAGVHWWEPWVWVSLINMVTAYISMPVQVQLASLNPSNLPPDQLEQNLEMMEKFGFVGIVTIPVWVLLMGVIVAGISYLVLSVLSDRSRFKGYFCLYLYANIVLGVGTLLSTYVARSKGVENIRSLQDAYASFGPALLLSEPHSILTPVLGSLDVFYLWFYGLIAIGVAYVFKTTVRTGVIVAVPIWLLTVLMELVRSQFGGVG
jgi:hypothetical protein